MSLAFTSAAVAGDPPRQPVDDPALPGLAGALDPHRVADLLARRAPAFAGRTPELRVRHVRYVPGRVCRVAFDAAVRERNGAVTRHVLYGRLDADPEAALEGHEREALAASGTAGGDGPPAGARRPAMERAIQVLPEIPMVVRLFPHDAVLRRLPRLDRLEPLKDFLESRLRADGVDWKVPRARIEVDVVRYKPERRCVLRLELRGKPRGAGDGKRRLVLYGHVDGDGAGARTHALMQALARHEGPSGPLAVARPWGYDPTLNLLLEEEVVGSPLADSLRREDLKKIVRRLAVRLVDLQRSGVVPRRRLTVADQIAAVEEIAATLGRVAAVDRALVRRTAETLVASAACATDPPLALAHGDLHHRQVIVKGRRTWMVDLDRAAIGDPLIDVGSFLTHLEIEAAEGRLPAPEARRTMRVFRRSYAAAWPEAMDATRLGWQAAVHAYQAAAAPLRQLHGDWPRLVESRLRLAARILAGEVLR